MNEESKKQIREMLRESINRQMDSLFVAIERAYDEVPVPADKKDEAIRKSIEQILKNMSAKTDELVTALNDLDLNKVKEELNGKL